MESYDVAVIGAGMIGSSCAKYLCEQQGPQNAGQLKVALIGPAEELQDCHGAWHDEGRIVRAYDSGQLGTRHWQHFAVQSLKRFRHIEKKSGISFANYCGLLSVFLPASSSADEEVAGSKKGLQENADRSQDQGHSCRILTSKELALEFPYLNLPPKSLAAHQADWAGYVSPRRLVEAQQAVAEQSGVCQVVRGVVTRVESDVGRDGFCVHVRCAQSERVLWAGKVVLANGSYANLSPSLENLPLESDSEFDLQLMTETLAYIEVPLKQVEGLLRNMPSVLIKGPGVKEGGRKLDSSYILPPIQYPDGKYYLKLGHGSEFSTEKTTLKEVNEWYQNNKGGCPRALEELQRLAVELIPDLNVLSVHGGSCITTRTPDRLAPFIDEISPDFFVALGGCGYAAKGCDEIGKLAADLVKDPQGNWTPQVPVEDLRVKWRMKKKEEHVLESMLHAPYELI